MAFQHVLTIYQNKPNVNLQGRIVWLLIVSRTWGVPWKWQSDHNAWVQLMDQKYHFKHIITLHSWNIRYTYTLFHILLKCYTSYFKIQVLIKFKYVIEPMIKCNVLGMITQKWRTRSTSRTYTSYNITGDGGSIQQCRPTSIIYGDCPYKNKTVGRPSINHPTSHDSRYIF